MILVEIPAKIKSNLFAEAAVDVLGKFRCDLGVRERDIDDGLEVLFAVTGIVPDAIDHFGVDGVVFRKLSDRVGKVKFLAVLQVLKLTLELRDNLGS